MSGAEESAGERGTVVEMESMGFVCFCCGGVLAWCFCIQTVDGDRNGKIIVYGE